MRRSILLLSLPVLLAIAPTSTAQITTRSLEPGSAVERNLAGNQTHSYIVALDKNQFVQLSVAQRNIDVVVRVFLPDGTRLMEADSPTGTEGTEYVEFVAESSGNYRIEVCQLPDGDASGQYEIKIEELRKATEQELQSQKNEHTRKGKGLALVIETMPYVDSLRLPETRVEMRSRAAELMWKSDPKQATKFLGQAVQDIKDLIAQIAERDEPDYERYQLATTLRQRIIHALAPHDPEAALNFLRSTRPPDNIAVSAMGADTDLQLEFQLANQVVAADPKRAFDLAEDLLKRTYSPSLIETLRLLESKDRELAVRLAHDIAAELTHQDLLKKPQAAYLAVGLVSVLRTSQVGAKNRGEGRSTSLLLSDDDYRDLVLKLIADFMSYSRPSTPADPREYEVVHQLAILIREMTAELQTYAADRSGAINKKIDEVMGPADQANDWLRYQKTATSAPVETALESVAEAPTPMRDYLVQQVATRMANSGDVARARQIVSERITDPTQRQAALNRLRQQTVTLAAEKGHFDQALSLLSKFRPGSERDDLVIQVLQQIGPGTKKQLALQYLAQGRNLIASSPRAENQEQMQSLLALAGTFARYDVNQAFEIVEPLLDQFNEISAAAVTMNGFGQDYYRDGELITSNDNPIADTANQFSETLATLAMYDFDRAKSTTEGINRLDVRIRIFMLIAQRTMEIRIEPDETSKYDSNE